MNNIFHPTDFSSSPKIAFAHALKLALATQSRLTIFHVNKNLDKLNWHEFPSVRATLSQWDLFLRESSNQAKPSLKIDVEKILFQEKNPSAAILKHLDRHPTDLIVLATQQLGGNPFFSSISEPVSRKSQIMTLFIPLSTDGFISVEDGKCQLRNILVPITHDPSPHSAVHAVTSLTKALDCQHASVTFLYIGDEKDQPANPTPQHHSGDWKYCVKTGDVVEEILNAERDLESQSHRYAYQRPSRIFRCPSGKHNGTHCSKSSLPYPRSSCKLNSG